MTTLEDIEKAVVALPADRFAQFRAWFGRAKTHLL
jgi:hypothetical protein